MHHQGLQIAFARLDLSSRPRPPPTRRQRETNNACLRSASAFSRVSHPFTPRPLISIDPKSPVLLPTFPQEPWACVRRIVVHRVALPRRPVFTHIINLILHSYVVPHFRKESAMQAGLEPLHCTLGAGLTQGTGVTQVPDRHAVKAVASYSGGTQHYYQRGTRTTRTPGSDSLPRRGPHPLSKPDILVRCMYGVGRGRNPSHVLM